MTHFIPLLARSFAEHTPESWQAYVRSLYVDPPVPEPPAEFTVRLNAKGTPVITIRRLPKFLRRAEVDQIALAAGWTKQDTWNYVCKKKIEVRK